jgi:hypothetical protein
MHFDHLVVRPQSKDLDQLKNYRYVCAKALQKIDIVHINIKNFRGKLPKNYSSDLQALFRLKKDKRNETRIVGLNYEIEGINCKTEVTTKCSLCHQEQCWCPKHIMEIKPDIFWKMSNPEFFAATSKFFSDFYNQEKWYHGEASILRSNRRDRHEGTGCRAVFLGGLVGAFPIARE